MVLNQSGDSVEETSETRATSHFLQIAAWEKREDLICKAITADSSGQRHKKMVDNFKRALSEAEAEPTNGYAQYRVGLHYKDGIGVEHCSIQMEHWLMQAGNNDVAAAWFVLGVYSGAKGTAEDDKKAATYFFKAAEIGHQNASYNLGRALEHGIGIQKSKEKSTFYYQKAAEDGHEMAQYNLGVAYAKGEGINRDSRIATKWLFAAAKQSRAEAIPWLHYLANDGIIAWLMPGYLDAQLAYGALCFLNPDLVRIKKGFFFLNKAEQQQTGYAGLYLGLLKEYIQSNSKDAIPYYEQAIDQGDTLAILLKMASECVYAKRCDFPGDSDDNDHYGESGDHSDYNNDTHENHILLCWWENEDIEKTRIDSINAVLLIAEQQERYDDILLKLDEIIQKSSLNLENRITAGLVLGLVYEYGLFGIPRNLQQMRLYYHKANVLVNGFYDWFENKLDVACQFTTAVEQDQASIQELLNSKQSLLTSSAGSARPTEVQRPPVVENILKAF